MDEIIQKIEEFKQIRLRNSITPESLGNLLADIVGAVNSELTTTIENITRQGDTTIENIQQQLQTTVENIQQQLQTALQSVTEQIDSALSTMEQQEQEHTTAINEELTNTRLNIQQMVNTVREQMQEIEQQVAMTTLEVVVATSKLEFQNKDKWASVWNAMQNNKQMPFCIAVIYASGAKNFYYPTCVKNNYISLNAKSGSCELHVTESGTFTITGTSLW